MIICGEKLILTNHSLTSESSHLGEYLGFMNLLIGLHSIIPQAFRKRFFSWSLVTSCYHHSLGSTLPETNMSPLKNGAWETIRLPILLIFRGYQAIREAFLSPASPIKQQSFDHYTPEV